MPLFEYRCKSCGRKYEALVITRSRPNPPCPSCNSHEVDKLYSSFGFGGSSHRGDWLLRPSLALRGWSRAGCLLRGVQSRRAEALRHRHGPAHRNGRAPSGLHCRACGPRPFGALWSRHGVCRPSRAARRLVRSRFPDPAGLALVEATFTRLDSGLLTADEPNVAWVGTPCTEFARNAGTSTPSDGSGIPSR